ncbi:hypothetical protein COO16_03915 [Bacillus pseudomycoides]|nr:hypothetical protein COO16_03915 [Bacillus pseudomycoides]
MERIIVMNRKKWIKVILSVFILVFSFSFALPTYAVENGGGSNPADDALNKDEGTLKKEMDKDLKETKLDGSGLKEVPEGKGKLYETYKDEIEKWKASREKITGKGSADPDIDLIKKLNYVKGEFDCGWTEVSCHITNVVYGATTSIINWTMIPFSKVVLKPSDILKNNILNDYLSAFRAITRGLLLLFFIFQIFKMVALRLTDMQSATQEGNEKVITFVIAGFLVFGYVSFFTAIMNIQYLVNYPLMAGLTATESVGKLMSLNMMFMGSFSMTIIFLAIVAVLILVLILQMYYSIALISVLYVTGPVAITTMLNSEYNFFNVWLRVLVSRLLTMGLQALCIVLGIRTFAHLSFDPVTTLTDSITGIAFFIVAITIPSLLGQFGNSSGSGRAVMGGAKSVTRYLSRR